MKAKFTSNEVISLYNSRIVVILFLVIASLVFSHLVLSLTVNAVQLHEGNNVLFMRKDQGFSADYLTDNYPVYSGSVRTFDDSGNFVEADWLEPGQTYFIDAEEAFSFSLKGDLVHKDAIYLHKSWNLAGANQDVSASQIRNACKNPYVFTTDDQGNLDSVNSMTAGKGYYVRVDESCTIDLSGGKESKILPVPYYSQGQTNWCMLANVIMLQKLYKKPFAIFKDSDPWHVEHLAKRLDRGQNQGTLPWPSDWPWEDGLGNLWMRLKKNVDVKEDYLKAKHLPNPTFEDFKKAIDSFHPVVLNMARNGGKVAGHVSLVVGYIGGNEKKLVIHDPSGSLTDNLKYGRTKIGEDAYEKIAFDKLKEEWFENIGGELLFSDQAYEITDVEARLGEDVIGSIGSLFVTRRDPVRLNAIKTRKTLLDDGLKWVNASTGKITDVASVGKLLGGLSANPVVVNNSNQKERYVVEFELFSQSKLVAVTRKELTLEPYSVKYPYLSLSGKKLKEATKYEIVLNLYIKRSGEKLLVDWIGKGSTPIKFKLSSDALFATTKPQIATFHAGTWWVDANGNGQWDGPNTDIKIKGFGSAGNQVAIADLDNDGTDELATFKAGTWWIDKNDNFRWDGPNRDKKIPGFGTSGNKVAAADFDNDGKAEIATFNRGNWWVDMNNNGEWDGNGTDLKIDSFGNASNQVAAADFDGDGRGEIATFKAGTWWIDLNNNGKWDGKDVDKKVRGYGTASNIVAAGNLPAPSSVSSAYIDLNRTLSLTSALAYPNPASSTDQVTFKAQGKNIRATKLQVFTASGEEVYKTNYTQGTTTTWKLNTNEGKPAPNGAYLYQVKARGEDGQTTTSQFEKLIVLK